MLAGLRARRLLGEPASGALGINNQKTQVPPVGPRSGPRRLLETSIPQIRPPARWHEDVRKPKQKQKRYNSSFVSLVLLKKLFIGIHLSLSLTLSLSLYAYVLCMYI